MDRLAHMQLVFPRVSSLRDEGKLYAFYYMSSGLTFTSATFQSLDVGPKGQPTLKGKADRLDPLKEGV
jgi:hypothetical protein